MPLVANSCLWMEEKTTGQNKCRRNALPHYGPKADLYDCANRARIRQEANGQLRSPSQIFVIDLRYTNVNSSNRDSVTVDFDWRNTKNVLSNWILMRARNKTAKKVGSCSILPEQLTFIKQNQTRVVCLFFAARNFTVWRACLQHQSTKKLLTFPLF